MQRLRILVGLLLVTACDGGNAAPQPDGPAKLGVIAGNNQVVSAAPVVQNRLPQDVVAQVVRLPNGQVALRTRIVDALLPEKAYAQTGVTGIAGQVVCATQPDPMHKLSAEVPCATSDATGKAYFVFHADTLAGVSKAQVAAALPTGTKVTDSVSATVLAGAFARSLFQIGWAPPNAVAQHPEYVADRYGNAVPYKLNIPTTSATITQYDSLYRRLPDLQVRLYAHVQNDTLGTVGARTVVVDSLTGVVFQPGARMVNGACASVQIVTAAGVSLTAVITVTREAPIQVMWIGMSCYAS